MALRSTACFRENGQVRASVAAAVGDSITRSSKQAGGRSRQADKGMASPDGHRARCRPPPVGQADSRLPSLCVRGLPEPRFHAVRQTLQHPGGAHNPSRHAALPGQGRASRSAFARAACQLTVDATGPRGFLAGGPDTCQGNPKFMQALIDCGLLDDSPRADLAAGAPPVTWVLIPLTATAAWDACLGIASHSSSSRNAGEGGRVRCVVDSVICLRTSSAPATSRRTCSSVRPANSPSQFAGTDGRTGANPTDPRHQGASRTERRSNGTVRSARL